jgi:organic radical activating enzyme
MIAKIINNFPLTFLDYPDNISHAIIIYMMGCDNECVDCQNIQFKDNHYADNTKNFTVEELIQKINIETVRNNTKKVILSGGDPCSKFNIDFTKQFLKQLNRKFDVCVYTGKDINFIVQSKIDYFTFIKSSPYIQEFKQKTEKTNEYMTFASTNQELYDDILNLMSHKGKYFFR